VMHDGMHYDPIQGQGQGHELAYLFPHLEWGLANDHGFLN